MFFLAGKRDKATGRMSRSLGTPSPGTVKSRQFVPARQYDRGANLTPAENLGYLAKLKGRSPVWNF